MIRIAITPAAFDAIAATLPLGSVGYEAKRDAQGNCLVWFDEWIVNRLSAFRGPGESYSDVIVRLFVGRDGEEGMKELQRLANQS
jgi:hypothetical protein